MEEFICNIKQGKMCQLTCYQILIDLLKEIPSHFKMTVHVASRSKENMLYSYCGKRMRIFTGCDENAALFSDARIDEMHLEMGVSCVRFNCHVKKVFLTQPFGLEFDVNWICGVMNLLPNAAFVINIPPNTDLPVELVIYTPRDFHVEYHDPRDVVKKRTPNYTRVQLRQFAYLFYTLEKYPDIQEQIIRLLTN